MLKENTLPGFQNIDKVQVAIERLQCFEPPEGYYLAFSGGKDSCVIKALADMAGVKYDAHYSVTTIDPPELIYFIREHHPDVKFDRPKRPFLEEMVDRGFPLRQKRWCCDEYKERGGTERVVLTGIRWAESPRRKNQRKMNEHCYKDTSKRLYNIIIDWGDKDVWAFIKDYKIPYCKLYDEGWKRIGCLFCPMAYYKQRDMEVALYPRFVKNFERAFEKLYIKKKAEGKISVDRWKNGKEMFQWWINSNPSKIAYNKDQGVLFE